MTTLTSSPRSTSLRRPAERTAALALRWGTVVVVVLAWELVCRGPLANNGYLASPTEVVFTGLPAIAHPEPLQAIGHTTARFLATFSITAVLGTMVGLLAGRAPADVRRGPRRLLDPLLPADGAVLPAVRVWLGLGTRSEVAFGSSTA